MIWNPFSVKMKSCSFRGSFLLLNIFWINANGQHCMVDTRFVKYKKCIENNLVPTWKLLGPQYNASFYDILNFRFNKFFEKAYPIAIFTPTSSVDVQTAVKCGIKTDIHLVPVSGGHSYAGLSFGTNDAIIVDFYYMNGISINRKEKIVSVESAAFIGHVYGTLWENGRLGASLGTCGTVAMGGLALGGGIGYFSSLYGLVIDNLVEINMVDASGNAITVNKTHNEDLWWAMRGVGPGYIGLVTSVKLKVFKADDLKLTVVKLRFYNHSFKNVMESYIKWLDWVKRNDPSINSVITIRSEAWSGIEIQLLQVKDPRIKTTGDPAFLNVSQCIFPEPVDFDVTFPTYIEFVLNNNYVSVNKAPPKPHTIKNNLEFLSSLTRDNGAPKYFFAKSFFVKKPYSAENLREAEKVLLEIPNSSSRIHINSEQGAISRRRPNEMAYVHRDALFNFKVYFEGVNADHVGPSKIWMKKFLKSVKFLDSGNTYQNYPERDLRDYLDRYYGSNLEKLIDIKSKWDPNGYFQSQMSLPID